MVLCLKSCNFVNENRKYIVQMGENKIELKSVSELLGMKFAVLNYQRGYMWKEQ